MASFKGSVSVTVTGSLTGTQDIGSVGHNVNKSYKAAFTNGTGINQANEFFSDTRTIAGSSNDDIDLAGVLTNALGETITFTSIKAIVLNSLAANADNIHVGAEGTNVFGTMFGDDTDLIKLVPGGTIAVVNPEATGYVVTATTGDMLRLANQDSGSVTYDILIIGEV